MRDVHLEGGNWQDGVDAGFFACTAQAFQRKRWLVPFFEFDTDGLPERWIKIVRQEVRWGNTGCFKIFSDEPEVHCIKEGLWKW